MCKQGYINEERRLEEPLLDFELYAQLYILSVDCLAEVS